VDLQRTSLNRFFLGEAIVLIYIATNKVNGKKYVGQTVRPVKTRWQRHLAAARFSEQGCRALNCAIRKYGAESFELTIIALPEGSTQDDLNLAERETIKRENSRAPHGYNLWIGGEGRGGQHPETRARIGAAHKGMKRSPEARARMSAAHKGKKQDPAFVERRVAALRGKPLSAEHRAKIGRGNTGKKQTPEWIAKLRLTRLGRVPPNKGTKGLYIASEETRRKIGLASAGRTHNVSAETRAKISAANKGKTKGRKHSPERRQAIADSITAWWAKRREATV
jgi:group I intron endonuclease